MKKYSSLLVFIVIAVLLPVFTTLIGKKFYLTQLTMSAYYALAAMGLCLLLGYCGQSAGACGKNSGASRGAHRQKRRTHRGQNFCSLQSAHRQPRAGHSPKRHDARAKIRHRSDRQSDSNHRFCHEPLKCRSDDEISQG